jgi:hypothetical protein
MDYQDLTHADQQAMARSSLKDLEAQHFQACIQIAANKGVPGTNLRELEQRKSAIELGLRNLRREYADLLAEPSEPAAESEPEHSDNGRVLSVVTVD